MAFTVFVDGAKLCAQFSWNGVACTTCVHFVHDDPGPAEFQELADEFAASYAIQMMPHASDELILGDVVVYDLSEENAPKYISSDENPTPGTDGTDAVPNNTAAVLSHRTDTIGRSGRGRSYIMGVSEVQESGGTLGSAVRDLLLTDWADLITQTDGIGWTFSVAQRFEDGQQLTTGVMRPVTSEIMTLQLGTQRRRQVPSAT